MLPKVLTCEDKYNPHKNDLQEEIPDMVGTKLEINLEIKETSRWVFYWAAESGSDTEGDKPEDPATSYGSVSNRGLTKTDKDGNTTLVLNCPKLYKEDGQLYPRHVHYTVLTKDDVWSTTIGTLEVMCKVPYELMKTIIKKKTYLVMNALSKESFAKKHIPNSILCHHESLEGLAKQKKDGIIKQVVKKSLSEFPKVKEFIDSVDSIKEVPIIVYCAHDECEASSKLISHLYDCGYYNVMEYPGGLKEWFSETDDKKFFDDIPSDEEMSDNVSITPETKLPDDEEIIVYDGVEYIHKLDETNDGEEDILTMEDMEHVGIYDGTDIVWNTSIDYKEHLERKGKKGDKIKDDVEEDTNNDNVEDDNETDNETDNNDDNNNDNEAVKAEKNTNDGDNDEDTNNGDNDEDTEDEDTDDEDEDDDEGDTGKLHKNKEYLQSKTIREIRELLDKLGKNNTKGSKKKLIDCLMNCNETEITGGGHRRATNDSITYGGGPQIRINQQFRGWGFTF